MRKVQHVAREGEIVPVGWYILDQIDSPLNHPAQLEELAKRVAKECSKIKTRGTGVRSSDDPAWSPEQQEKVTRILWSSTALEVKRKDREEHAWVFPRLR